MTIVTFNLPEDVMQKIERLAQLRQTTVASLMAETITNLVSKVDYAEAHRLHDELVGAGFELGTYGKPLGPRDELYDR